MIDQADLSKNCGWDADAGECRAFDAVVAGGGLAGLTCAAYLCRNGCRTLLCEKRPKTGGLVETFWHRGFAFDAGIRAFENSGILYPMLKNLGVPINFVKNPISVGIAEKWIRFDEKDGISRYEKMLTEIFPDRTADILSIVSEIRKVIGYMDVLYGIDNPIFTENLLKDRAYLTKTLLPWLIRYQKNIRKASLMDKPIYEHLRGLTSDAALIDMIAQHFFRGTPAFFALSYFGQYSDYCYPEGGTGRLAEEMTKYVLGKGGAIRTEAPIVRVDLKKHAVRLQNGETFRYGSLVWAANQKTLYAASDGGDSKAFAKQKLLAEQSRGGDSVLTIFMGSSLDRAYFESCMGAHAFYTPSPEGLSTLPRWEEACRGGEEELFDFVGSYLERTTYEISCPALRDPSLAPSGQTGVIISTLMDYGLARHIADAGKYEALKQFCVEKVTFLLDATAFPGLAANVLFTICATPLTQERETGNAGGAITGWAFSSGQMPAEHRFKKIINAVKTPIKDVWQCGQWTFSPSGLPVSILTGKLAADAICKTRKKRTS